MQYYVYILTNKNCTTLYVGVTNNLERTLYEHKHKLIEGFTSRYNVDVLVYYEITTDSYSAIAREKQIKSWKRAKKNQLINENNPAWKDLSLDFN